MARLIFLLVLISISICDIPQIDSTDTADAFHQKAISFIGNFNSKLFCNIILLENSPNPAINDFNSNLQASLIHPGHEALKSFYKINLNTLYNSKSKDINSHKDIQRYSPTCYLIILEFLDQQISDNPAHISRLLFQLLTKRYGGITKKDEDFFFVISPGKDLDNFLAMNFFQKVKKKLILTSGSRNELKAYSGKFFPFAGESLRIEFNIGSDPTLQNFDGILKNFEGRRLRVTSPTRILFSIELERMGGLWFVKRGPQAFVFKELQRIFNFTYHLVPNFSGTGSEKSNGRWSGTVGDLYDGKVDLALRTGQVYRRDLVIGFLKPFDYSRMVFTVGFPKNLYSASTIYRPLSQFTWLYFGLSIVIFMSIILLLNKKDLKTWELDRTIKFTIASIIHQQGVRYKLRVPQNQRIFIYLWQILVLVLSIAYQSRLFQFLIFPRMESVPTTFEELINRPDYSFGLESAGHGGALEADLKTSPHATYKRIYQKMSMEYDSVACFLKEKFACMTYQGQVEYIFARNLTTRSRKFPLILSKESTFAPLSSGFGIEKNAVFKTNFNKRIGQMLDSGLIDKWIKMDHEDVGREHFHWEKESNTRPIFNETYFYNGWSTLSLAELRGMYYIYTGITFVGILAFILEILPKIFESILYSLVSRLIFNIRLNY